MLIFMFKMRQSSVRVEPPKTGIFVRVKPNIFARQTPSEPVERSGAAFGGNAGFVKQQNRVPVPNGHLLTEFRVAV